jgi:hypothetical protein
MNTEERYGKRRYATDTSQLDTVDWKSTATGIASLRDAPWTSVSLNVDSA